MSVLLHRQRTDLRIPRNVGDELGNDLAHARVARPHVFRGVAHHGETDGRFVIERITLPQHADAQAARMAHQAVFGLDRAGQHAEQRRFAVAVLAHDADAVALVHAERHVVENLLRRICKMDAFASEQKCHVARLLHSKIPFVSRAIVPIHDETAECELRPRMQQRSIYLRFNDSAKESSVESLKPSL